ncbi:MAG: UvrD-helicase domain-containing protein [Muribaculaceae bacterium]|nr:UvrD-helicase domain-containing protein [Muribaculaceae bacterium]
MLNIYKASAGSGKTYTLAYEYIRMLLGQRLPGKSGYVLNDAKYLGGAKVLAAPHERILAITFTNKATAEMKSRIIKELEALTFVPEDTRDDSDYAARLVKEYGCTREELATVASRALRKLLADYGRFNVSTIDAFFQTVLRSFAREIDRQGDYRLEIDPLTVLSESMSMLLDEVNHPSSTSGIADVASADDVRHIRRWLMDRSHSRLNESADFNPFDNSRRMYNGLIGYLEKAFSEEFTKRQADMDEYLADASRLEGFVDGLKRCAESLRVRAYALAQDTLSQLPVEDIDANVIKYWQKFTPDSGFKVSPSEPKFISKVETGNPDRVVKKTAMARSEYYLDVLAKAVAECRRGAAVEEIVAELRRTVYGVKALSFINRYVDRYRRDNNLILLSDTNTLLNSIISEEDAPFIFERVGVQLQNFMIDEFQDTSELQWRHLSPLLRNSLGSDFDSLIIGDVKQSIYRWRGADSELLDYKVESQFPGRSSVRGDRPGENTNYRSSHTVVRFNNTLFELLANRPGLTPDITAPVPGYSGIAQDLPEKTASLTGRVCFSLEDIPETVKDTIASELGGISNHYIYAERIARNIRGQIERGYAQRDIAILVRTEAEAVAIATYIQKYYPDINLVSEQALRLGANLSVRKIIAALELISRGTPSLDPEVNAPVDEDAPDAPQRKNARKRRMRRLMVDCFNYYVAHGLTVSEALDQAVRQVGVSFPDESATQAPPPDVPVPFDGPDHDLREVRRRAPANLPALAEAVVELKIPPQERRENAQYILALLDVINEFNRDNIPTLNSFLRFWKAQGDRINVAADSRRDAVTISTVHKAKGLEWDCVHVPLNGKDLLRTPGDEWYDTDGLGTFLKRETGIDPGTPPPLMYLSSKSSFGIDGCPLKSQYDYHLGKSVSDNMNVAYVAFTRAVRELDIYEIEGKTGTLGEALIAAFTGPGASALAGGSGVYINLPAEATATDSTFEIGEPTFKEVEEKDVSGKKKRPDPMNPIGGVPLPVIEVEFTADSDKAAVTRLADLTYLDETDDDPATGAEQDRHIVDRTADGVSDDFREAQRRGIEIHSILSRMYTIDDLDDSLAFHRGRIPVDRLEMLGSLLRESFAKADPRVLRWFSPENPRILTEQPVFDPVTREHTRVDRIVWDDNGTVSVIDYKCTSRPHDDHRTQVRDYALSLRAMGLDPVEAYLWYPLSGEVIKVEV